MILLKSLGALSSHASLWSSQVHYEKSWMPFNVSYLLPILSFWNSSFEVSSKIMCTNEHMLHLRLCFFSAAQIAWPIWIALFGQLGQLGSSKEIHLQREEGRKIGAWVSVSFFMHRERLSTCIKSCVKYWSAFSMYDTWLPVVMCCIWLNT